MKTYLKASLVACALLVSGVLVSPSAQVAIQRGYETVYNLTVQNRALFADGTAAAPGIAFANAPTSGWYLRDTGIGAFTASVLGVPTVDIAATHLSLRSEAQLVWSATDSASGGPDLRLIREEPGVLAMRNGTNAQTFFVGATNAQGSVRYGAVLLASLGTPANGTVTYCSDCAPNSSPCTGTSTGAIAKRLNNAWDCR